MCTYLKGKVFSDITRTLKKKKTKSNVSKSKIKQENILKKLHRNKLLNHLVSLLTRA